MIYPDEAMLYAPVEWHDCSEGFEDIRYEKSTDVPRAGHNAHRENPAGVIASLAQILRF